MLKFLSETWAAVVNADAGPLRSLQTYIRSDPRSVSYDMLFKDPKDGCARYDDIWGG